MRKPNSWSLVSHLQPAVCGEEEVDEECYELRYNALLQVRQVLQVRQLPLCQFSLSPTPQ